MLPVVLYDGDCGFCQACVDLILRHSSLSKETFLDLGSRQARDQYGSGEPLPTDSVVWIDGGTVLIRSDAVLAVLARCEFPLRLLRFARWLPKIWRDKAYDIVVRARHRWPGGSCDIGP